MDLSFAGMSFTSSSRVRNFVSGSGRLGEI